MYLYIYIYQDIVAHLGPPGSGVGQLIWRRRCAGKPAACKVAEAACRISDLRQAMRLRHPWHSAPASSKSWSGALLSLRQDAVAARKMATGRGHSTESQAQEHTHTHDSKILNFENESQNTLSETLENKSADQRSG